MSNPSERKAGITTTAEEVRQVLSAKTFSQLNQVYSDEVAKIMLDAWRLEKSVGPRAMEFIRGVADKKKSGFREIFFQIAENQKMTEADERAVAGAWSNVMKKAEERFKELLKQMETERLQASAPPLPTHETISPGEEEFVVLTEGISIIPDTLPDSLNAEMWMKEWGTKPLDNTTVGDLNFAFSNALAEVISLLPNELLQEAKKIYTDIVRAMYETTYPGQVPESIDSAIESYWIKVLAATRLIVPAVKQAEKPVS